MNENNFFLNRKIQKMKMFKEEYLLNVKKKYECKEELRILL